jgi:hypothetical protein
MATIQTRTALVSTVSAAPAVIPASWDRFAWILFAGLTAAVLLTFRHYGITFDEEVQKYPFTSPCLDGAARGIGPTI